MSNGVVIPKTTITKKQDLWTADYLTRSDGTPLLISDIVSWDLRVFDTADTETALFQLLSQPATAIGAGGVFSNVVLPADAFSDVPYTFRHRLLASTFTREGGHVYQLEYAINTVDLGTIEVIAQAEIYPTYTE